MIGRQLRHYHIVEEISRGGMGVVYRATDVRLQRDVALKVLPEELMHDLERKRRFIQEAQAASALEHPNIAVIHDVDEADGHTFIAMELIRGDKLSDVLTSQRLSPARSLELATEIASGLARAHDKGIVHRDLKPANVMVSEEGNAKIIDFGIAKLIERDAAVEANAPTIAREDTAAGVVLGTTTYMSPEQTRGERVDHRSDIFSFGIVLHEMLSGQPPFQGRSGMETASAILHQPAPRLTSLGPAVLPDACAELQRMLDKCLAKEPAERYQGMKDVIVDLRAARRRLESTAHAVVVPRQRRAPARLTIAATAALIITAAVLYWRAADESPRPGALTASGKPSVAVLYFDNASNTKELEWLRTGITEMVVTDLSQSQDIEVVATDQLYDVLDDLRRADDRTMSPELVRAIAERTGVTNVIVGSYLKAGSNIRINVRLQEARTGRIVSSERVEGASDAALFSMVDDLSRRLLTRFAALRSEVARGADLLRRPASVAPAELDRGLEEVTTSSIEAYKYYAEGINLHDRSREMEAAVQFEKAVAVDPAFAMAHAKLAVAHGNMGNLAERDKYASLALQHSDRMTPRERYYIEGYAFSNRNSTTVRSLDAYRKCLEVDPGHHACRHNLALRLVQLEERVEAIAHYEELVRRGTTNPSSFENLATAYVATGEVERAINLMKGYVERHPDIANGYEAYGMALMMNGRYDEAIAAFKRGAVLDPTNSNVPFQMVTTYVLSARLDDATAVAKELAQSAEATRRWLGGQSLRHLALLRGRSTDALAATELAISAYPAGQRSAGMRYNAAGIHLARGNAAAALAEAQRALDEGRNTPAEPNIRVLLVQIAAELRRMDDARRLHSELVTSWTLPFTKPHDRRVLLAQGFLARAAGDLPGAIAAMERAEASLSPRSPNPGGQSLVTPIRFALAESYRAAGRHADALKMYEKVVNSTYERWAWPLEYVRSLFFSGQMHDALRDGTRARDAYRKFVELWNEGDLDRARVAQARARLEGVAP